MVEAAVAAAHLVTDGKVDDVKGVVDALPTLADIEASTVLALDATVAKEATVAALNDLSLADVEGSEVLAKTADVTGAHATTDGKVDAVKSVVDAIATALQYQMQPDADWSSNTPSSGQYYEVLAVKANAAIKSVWVKVNWADTQPSNLAVKVTIDGQVYIFSMGNPSSGTDYFIYLRGNYNADSQWLGPNDDAALYQRGYILEGRSVKVEVAVTGVAGVSWVGSKVRYAKR